MLGVALALLAAASFALNSATARRGVLAGTLLQAIAITVPIGIPMFLLGGLLFGQLGKIGDLNWRAVVFLSLAGIVHFVWGRYFNYRAQYLMGSNLTASIAQMDMFLSLTLAIIILGEYLTPLKIAGIALVMLGPAFVVGTRGSADKARKEKAEAVAKAAGTEPVKLFEPKYAEGYVCVMLASCGYAMSPILTTLGLRELGAGASFVGGLVAYTAASVVALIWVLVAGQTNSILQTSPTAMRWFTIAGLTVGLSHICRFAALSMAPVTVVQPIQRLSKLFVFYFSWLLNRDKEVFDRSLILATVISVIGAVVLAIPAEVILGWSGWPDWFRTFMQWRIGF